MAAPRATRKQVEEFLSVARVAVDRHLFVVPRQEVKDALAGLGMFPADLKKVIHDLTVANYVSGPEEDRDPARGGVVWVFGAVLDEIEYYFKLKVETDEKGGPYGLVCLSFHEARYYMRYPYR